MAEVETVSWDSLEHAYGPASDVPALLETFSRAQGKKLHEATGELYSRVLHQGTIYSASPPVAHVAIEMCRTAEGEKKAILYDLLSGMAQASRKAIEDGVAIPCCAGGDPVDGAAIRAEILGAQQQFVADLSHKDAHVRGCAADLLTAFPEAEASAAQLVRDHYFVEQDAGARGVVLEGLLRVRSSVRDWPGFVNAALAQESEPDNRFSLRFAQIQEITTAAGNAAVEELVSLFLQTRAYPGGDERFFDALQSLGAEREQTVLLQAVDLVTSDEGALVIATHLLRRVFDDRRDGWGQTARSLLREDGSAPPQGDLTSLALKSIGRLILWKMFPFLLKRKMRQKSGPRKGISKIEYWGLKGEAPVLPRKLSAKQQAALTALAAQPAMWKFRTNLWALFGVADTADGLRRFVEDREESDLGRG